MLFTILKINGHSMEPTIRNGAFVFASSLPYFFKKPKVKDVVVFKRNNKNFVKRIFHSKGQEYFVKGDNTYDSIDSREFGSIKHQDIKAKILFVCGLKKDS